MAPESERRQAEILNKLIEISSLERRFISENKIDELMEAHLCREGLFKALDGSKAPASPELSGLARELAESDRLLAAEVSRVMDSIASRLGQVKTGMSALKAYGRY